ncbi:rhomboid family intramembrane serine protease [Oceanobacter mangrovi]|uniref:rhomboid family intramembrane serine protease n=1 Tax=Oceanobacter mangrovi TaxID=2862510 RepID=UPI001C8EB49E|nr:rhomboid family intramembrane serine protease [Oceanobacter mangrovi]
MSVLVLVAPPDVDLAPLTQQLWANRIAHRVIEVEGKQHLYLADAADVAKVRVWLQQWQTGDLQQVEHSLARQGSASHYLLSMLQTPFTLAVAVVLVAVFAYMQVSHFWYDWAQPGLGLWPQHKNSLAAYLHVGLLGWLKPTVLHFSLMHLVFNTMWWWILGRALERQDGVWRLLLLTLITALVGNLAQWWVSGPGFGGLSGVTYGLMGWIGWRQYQRGVPYPIPRMLLPLMAGFLLLTMAGDSIIPGLSGTANSAHLGGLVCGLLMAWVWPLSLHERQLIAAKQSFSRPDANDPDSNDQDRG